MNIFTKKFLTIAFLLSCGANFFPAQADPTSEEVVSGVIKRDKELQERRKVYDYDLTTIREKLKEDKSPADTTQEKSVVIGDKRPDYDTRPNLSPDEEAAKASKEEPFELLKVIDHFSYSLEAPEEVHGVLCYKLAYKPKPDMPYRNREEKVINAVSGYLWISQKDYSLMRNSGNLTTPVQVGWIFATLKDLEFSYESQLLPNGDYGPKQVSYRFQVSIPFGQIHERHTRKMANYRTSGGEKNTAESSKPVPAAAPAEKPSAESSASSSSSKH